MGTGVPPWGPPSHPGPAVHSGGMTALHFAALRGNRRIVRLLVASGADVNAQDDNDGCAVFRLRRIGRCVRRPSPRRRLPCRSTPLHDAAARGETDTVAELLLRGADGAVQNNDG